MMTTEKQAAANKTNATKSTGPTTPAGKAAVAKNATSHGILSKRLFLDGECPDDFHDLQDDLQQALRPTGALELALVEKAAVALWKQRRLVAAETAMLELGRSMRRQSVRDEVKTAVGLGYADGDITDSDLFPMDADDEARQLFCTEVIEQYARVDAEVLYAEDLAGLKEQAPALFKQLAQEAEQDGVLPEAYLKSIGKEYALKEWASALREWCRETLKGLWRRPLVQSVAQLVKEKRSAPIANELLMRYQVSLDGELYRAVEALRRQQAFRLRLGIDCEVIN